MPNSNLYVSAETPVLQGDDTRKLFSRDWFRFFTDMATKVKMLNGDSSTSATSGTASPLPATPAGYMMINDLDGIPRKVPYYNP